MFLFPHFSDEEPLHMQYGVQSNNRTQISALNKTGLNKLRGLIEEGIIASTGKEIKRLVIPPDGPQLRWVIWRLLNDLLCHIQL